MQIQSELPERRIVIPESTTDSDIFGNSLANLHLEETEFYDKFRLSLSGIRLLVTTEGDEGWRDYSDLDKSYARYAFVHTDVNLVLEKSIHPNEVSLTQLKYVFVIIIYILTNQICKTLRRIAASTYMLFHS